MSRVSYEWVVSRMNESYLIWMSRVTHKVTNESWRTLMSHVTYEWVMSHMNESCHVWLRHTVWRRCIGCLKLQVSFRNSANNYRALLRKMTYRDKASYDATPPCSTHDNMTHKRASNYRALLQKMTYRDEASYDTTPPCIWRSLIALRCTCSSEQGSFEHKQGSFERLGIYWQNAGFVFPFSPNSIFFFIRRSLYSLWKSKQGSFVRL